MMIYTSWINIFHLYVKYIKYIIESLKLSLKIWKKIKEVGEIEF